MSKLHIGRRIKYKFGGYRKRKNKSFSRYLLQIIIFTTVIISVLVFAGQRVCTLALNLGEVQLENELRYECNRIASDLLSEYDLSSSTLSQSLGNDGNVLSITADFTELNNFKLMLSNKLTERLLSYNEIVCNLPIGAFFSEDIFAAQGFKIPIKITSSGSVTVDFLDDFTSAGINQTRHRLMLRITAIVHLHTVYNQTEKEIITDIPITELITVGEVPSFVTYPN